MLVLSVRNTFSPNPTYGSHPHPKRPRLHAILFLTEVSGIHKPEVLSLNFFIIIDTAFVTITFHRLNRMILIFDRFD